MALLRPLISRSTYRGWAWLILGGAVLMPYMMAGEVVRVMVWRDTAQPFTLPVQPVTFLLVLPVVAVTGLFLPIRALLITTARGLLGVDIPPAPDRRDWRTRSRTAGWFTIQLAVGGVLSGVTLALLPFVAVSAVLPLLPEPDLVAGDLLGTGWQLWWGPVFGPLSVLGLIYLVAGSAAGLRRLAPRLLGPSAAEQLARAQQAAARLAARNRLARELHDSVGHALSVVTVQAAAAGRVLDRDPEFVRRSLAAVEETARRALGDLDEALRVLRDEPAEGESMTPPADLARLGELLASCGLQVDVELPDPLLELPGGVSREAYRIIQEALTNALRHGIGRSARLRLHLDGAVLIVEVTNPITGRAGRGGGRGIIGMTERVTALGGTLDAGPADGHWRVVARLPLRWPA